MRERNINVFASQAPPTGDLAGNPGMCPNWESNWRPSGSQAGTHSTEQHHLGLIFNYSESIGYLKFALTQMISFKYHK